MCIFPIHIIIFQRSRMETLQSFIYDSFIFDYWFISTGGEPFLLQTLIDVLLLGNEADIWIPFAEQSVQVIQTQPQKKILNIWLVTFTTKFFSFIDVWFVESICLCLSFYLLRRFFYPKPAIMEGRRCFYLFDRLNWLLTERKREWTKKIRRWDQ